jgi:cystathionine gamma-synthase
VGPLASLPEHPGHTVAAAQQSGFGAMVSFELAGGEAAVRAFVARRRAGIGDGLLRLSVGIEATEDLAADVTAGLNRALAAVEQDAR